MTTTLRIAIRRFGPFGEAIKKQFASFREATGADAELACESLDLDPLVDTMFTRGGLRDGRWDIGFVVTDWLPMASGGGHIADMAPLMASDPVPDYPTAWSRSLTRLQTAGGQVWGMPYHDGPQCLIYRTDLFADPDERSRFAARHGRPLEVPTTWSEYLDIVAWFSRPSEGRYGTVLAAFPDGHNAVYDFCIHLWSRGGELLDGNGRPALDTGQARETLEFYRSLAKRAGDLVHPGPTTIDSVRSGEIFAAGQIALMTNWFGFAAYAAGHPSSAVRGRVNVAPIPAGPGGRSVSMNIYWVLAIGSGSPHKELAWRFIRHCLSPEMDKLTTTEGAIGCRLSTWRDAAVRRQVPFYAGLEDLHAHARELPFDPRFPGFAHVIDGMVGEAISTDRPTGAILAEAQDRALAVWS